MVSTLTNFLFSRMTDCFNIEKPAEETSKKNLIKSYSEEELYTEKEKEGERASCIDFIKMPRARLSGIPTN